MALPSPPNKFAVPQPGFKACLSPPSSASVPTSPPHPLLSSFSEPHSFPQTPTPCPATSGCFLCPKATQQPSVQPPSPGVPERAPSQLTPVRGHCCSGIRLPQQAGRSRRAVPGVNPPIPRLSRGTGVGWDGGLQQALNKRLLGK